VIKTTADLPRK